jgi:hypothetical protein
MRWRYAEAQATVLLNDGFAVLDRERPDVDSKLGDKRHRLVRRERRPRRQRHARPLVARFTNDRWDNTIGVCDRFDTRLRRRRARQLPRLAARHAVSAVGRAAPRWRASRRPSGASCALPSRVRLAASWRLRVAVRARSSNSACCRWRAASTRPLSRSWLHTFRSFTTPRSLFNCLVDRFGKPLCRFNEPAPLGAPQWLAAQRDRVAHARPGLLRARLVSAALRERLSRRQRAVFRFAQLLVQRARRLPTRSRSDCVSPGETALPFHRKRPAYEASTKKMLKYCGDELDPKSRTLLDYHPVEVARQNGAGGARRLCARATERADVACLDEGRGRRATRATARTSSASSTSSTASAAGWRRK